MSMFLRPIFGRVNEALKPNNVKVLSNLSPFNGISKKYFANAPAPYEIIDPKANQRLQQEVIKQVNDQVSASQQGRLFAVIHIAGKQFKITEGDIIVIEGYWPPNPSEKIKLDKVLLAGAADFTLIGKPLVQDGLVNIYATVIEKTLSHTKTNFKKKRRKQYTNINFVRVQQTMLRINTIEINGEVNKPPDVTGNEHKIFLK